MAGPASRWNFRTLVRHAIDVIERSGHPWKEVLGNYAQMPDLHPPGVEDLVVDLVFAALKDAKAADLARFRRSPHMSTHQIQGERALADDEVVQAVAETVIGLLHDKAERESGRLS